VNELRPVSQLQPQIQSNQIFSFLSSCIAFGSRQLCDCRSSRSVSAAGPPWGMRQQSACFNSFRSSSTDINSVNSVEQEIHCVCYEDSVSAGDANRSHHSRNKMQNECVASSLGVLRKICIQPVEKLTCIQPENSSGWTDGVGVVDSLPTWYS